MSTTTYILIVLALIILYIISLLEDIRDGLKNKSEFYKRLDQANREVRLWKTKYTRLINLIN